MPSDKIELIIGNKVLTNFKSYSLNDDMFSIEDQFSIQLGHPDTHVKIPIADDCVVKVNDQEELIGQVEIVEIQSSKNEISKTISGRDITADLADTYVPESLWRTHLNLPLKEFVEMLLSSNSNFSHYKVIFGDLVTHKRTGFGSGDISLFNQLNTLHTQITPGQTYLDVLRSYCSARGYIFYGKSSNTIVFGYPKLKGKPDFTLYHGKLPNYDYNDANARKIAKEASLMRNINGQYNEILVVSQRQDLPFDTLVGGDMKDAYIFPELSPVYKHARRKVEGLPKNVKDKLFVSEAESDVEDLERYAELIEKQQSFDAFQLEYTVYGHSQNGINWRSSSLCYVEDDIFGIKGNFLIYSKTFNMSKNEGTTTTLRLCQHGALPDLV